VDETVPTFRIDVYDLVTINVAIVLGADIHRVEHSMGISSIGAATSAAPKSLPVKSPPPNTAASTQTAPTTGHKKHHPQIGQRGSLVNKLV
jgi:hypothetical protein